jgi:TonB family protein
MRIRRVIGSIVLAWLVAPVTVLSQNPTQSQITTITLGPDQIGIVKTGPAISTRVSFREPVQDIVCGDLYDPGSGTGAFVIQRIDNDVFIKPVMPRGISNMFVKTGEKRENTYNFSLIIVPVDEAYQIVNVMNALAKIDLSSKVARLSTVSRVSPPITQRLSASDAAFADGRESNSQQLSFEVPGTGGFETPPSPSPSLNPNSMRKVGRQVETPPSLSSPPLNPDSVRKVGRQVVRRVAAERPEVAKVEGVIGAVVVEVTIDESGKVTSARAVSGPVLLRGAAVVAAGFWKFSPAEPSDGRKLEIATIRFNFERSDRQTESGLQWLENAGKRDRRP